MPDGAASLPRGSRVLYPGAMKPAKAFFQAELIRRLQAWPAGVGAPRVLELGCGRAEVTRGIIEAVPGLAYVGIEPDPASVAAAKGNLGAYPNAQVLPGLGYGTVPDAALEEPFDVVFSLSVLEHVKDLPRFLRYAAEKARTGAEIIHLYDLGHALAPSSWKEWVQTRLCASPLLRFMPEAKVARYLATEDVRQLIEGVGCTVEAITFHNMPSHVSLAKALGEPAALAEEINAFERRWSKEELPFKLKEQLFRTVGFWAKKK